MQSYSGHVQFREVVWSVWSPIVNYGQQRSMEFNIIKESKRIIGKHGMESTEVKVGRQMQEGAVINVRGKGKRVRRDNGVEDSRRNLAEVIGMTYRQSKVVK